MSFHGFQNVVGGDDIRWVAEIGSSSVSTVHFSPDGHNVLATSGDTLIVVDARNGHVLQELIGHTSDVNDADASPDGRRYVTTSTDRTVRLWDAVTGREITNIAQAGPCYESVHFSADGKRIFGITSTGVFHVWNSE